MSTTKTKVPKHCVIWFKVDKYFEMGDRYIYTYKNILDSMKKDHGIEKHDFNVLCESNKWQFGLKHIDVIYEIMDGMKSIVDEECL